MTKRKLFMQPTLSGAQQRMP